MKDKFKTLGPALKQLGEKIMKFAADSSGDTTEQVIQTEAKDGTKIEIEGGLVKGAEVTVVSDDGSELPVPDGDIELKDGTILTCKGGKIDNIQAPSDPAQGQAMKEQKEQFALMRKELDSMKEQFKALKAENENLKKDLKASKEIQAETFKIVEKIAELPGDDKGLGSRTQTPGKEYSKMELFSAIQKVKHSK